MDEKGVSGSFMVVSEENSDSIYRMFFGVSCAFFALKFMPEPAISDGKWLAIRNQMVKGSAHLLGLLVWEAQKKVFNTEKSGLLSKLENAENEIRELKKRRSEDAKANEKVVSIFATREQSWCDERRILRQQIGALMNDLRVLETKKEESIGQLGDKMKEIEVILQLKDNLIEEADQKRLESEDKLRTAEKINEELRENVKSEICKHKTAFIELVSNQRQLEAEMGRTFRQIEAVKHELDLVLEQKEQLVLVNQRLSKEVAKTRMDLEQKDQILSAMLRKSKLDTAEKQMLLKGVKSSKAMRKQAELETARWRAVSESKHERYSLRNMLSKHVNTKGMMSLDAEIQKSVKNGCHSEPNLTGDAKHLENWISSEAEKYKIETEQRHQVEIDAFMDQLRQKDEKLEAYSWRLMSVELESKTLQSHIEALNHETSQLRQDSFKLEATLLDREAELHTLKEQLKLRYAPPNPHDASKGHHTDWSRVKIVQKNPGHERQEMTAKAEEISQVAEETSANDQNQDIVSTHKVSEEFTNAETSKPLGQGIISKRSNSTWKMDIHALGVSYKVKRLKQQLFMLERLTGKKESSENNEEVKGFYALMSVLNKQVDRYQSLQAKIDHLCMRMHENKLDLKCGVPTIARPEDETKRMEQFLEETFQVQRYIVATGQKLVEVQAKIASGFAQDMERPASFDTERFADNIKTMLREVQRGIELRISRIIGDLEGTLTCHGFYTSTK